MPREPRHIEPGTPYHIISRFVDREWFIQKQYEREYYLKLLGLSQERTDWRLYSYCVMSNHIHLAGLAGEQPLGDWIRRVHSPFATAMNRSYNRIGPMFVRGPKAYRVAPEAFGPLLAYIHNNPVRAGVCASAARSCWSSHRAYTGRADIPAWLDVGEGLRRAGFADGAAFDRWVNDPARAKTDHLFTEEHYELERCEARDLGLAREKDTKQSTAERIVVAAAQVLDITLDRLHSTSRGHAEVLARQVAVRCAVAEGVSGRAIAGALQLSEAHVSSLRRVPASSQVWSLCDAIRSVMTVMASSSERGPDDFERYP